MPNPYLQIFFSIAKSCGTLAKGHTICGSLSTLVCFILGGCYLLWLNWMMGGALTVKTGFISIQLEDMATFSWYYLTCNFVFVVFVCVLWITLYLADIGMQLFFILLTRTKKGHNWQYWKNPACNFSGLFMNAILVLSGTICELFQLFGCCSSAKGHMSLILRELSYLYILFDKQSHCLSFRSNLNIHVKFIIYRV